MVLLAIFITFGLVYLLFYVMHASDCKSHNSVGDTKVYMHILYVYLF